MNFPNGSERVVSRSRGPCICWKVGVIGTPMTSTSGDCRECTVLLVSGSNPMDWKDEYPILQQSFGNTGDNRAAKFNSLPSFTIVPYITSCPNHHPVVFPGYEDLFISMHESTWVETIDVSRKISHIVMSIANATESLTVPRIYCMQNNYSPESHSSSNWKALRPLSPIRRALLSFSLTLVSWVQ